MTDLLALSRGLPERVLAPGEVLARDGEPGGPVWVLVSGELEVRKGDVVVAGIGRPGALVGEMSVLAGTPSSATVVARTAATVRVANDGAAFLAGDGRVMRLVAEELSRRLAFVTAYLADLRHQYGDAPGLSMVDDVLAELAQQPPPPARPGSAREPDPAY